MPLSLDSSLLESRSEMHRPLSIVIPFRLDGAKSRLSPLLSSGERRMLALAMLKDVLATVRDCGEVSILTRPGWHLHDTGPLAPAGQDARIVQSDLELNDALNMVIEGEALQGWRRDILIVMADLALLAGEDMAGILSRPGDVVLCPGLAGGTNMILIRSPAFRTCYQGLSYPKHLDFAARAGLSVSVYESFRAGCDIDEPGDLAEILLHGRGEARELLAKWGFQLWQMIRNSKGDGPIMRQTASSDGRLPNH